MHAAVVPAAQVGAHTVGRGGSKVLPQSGQGGVIVVTSLPRDTARRSHAKQGTTTIGISIMNKVRFRHNDKVESECPCIAYVCVSYT